MAFIEVHDLAVRYPRAVVPALQGLSFDVERGETLLLLGPSGSGKSTIGLCLAGLIPRSVPAVMSGQIHLASAAVGGTESLVHNGAPHSGGAAPTAGAGERAIVGMVFQDPEAQFCMLTVEDEVAFGLENLALPVELMDGRIRQALAQVGLTDRRRERVDRLSGGQKQRLALACALARRPEVLFLDEPTANLDPATRHEFFEVLAALRRETPELTILIVEHVLDDLIALVDRVLILDHGGVARESGPPARVFDTESELLDRMGIWLPQVTALGRKLRLAGLPLTDLPLTVEAAAHAFESYIRVRTLDVPQPRRGSQRSALFEGTGEELAMAVRDLTFAYGGGPEVLHHVSLDVARGGFLALVGPNGSGKTTLASHLVNILRPPSGTVYLFGDDITTLSAAQITERVGYVFQNPEHQLVESTVGDELAYSLRVRGRQAADIASVVDRLLDTFGLAAHRRQNPFSLSQGQKRRLSVATMLAVGQRALVLDEPTFGQDRGTAHALLELLRRLHAGGVTLFAITHDMQMVADYVEAVVVLVEGQIAFVGPTSVLFARPALLAAASLRSLPLHDLARQLDVGYADGTLPLSIRDWMPFFDLA